jgi:enoyl-[acyl-carrier protein] reductase II
MEMDIKEAGVSANEIRKFLGYSRARTGQLEGDLVNGEAYCGASAGLISEILPAAIVIQRIVDGYKEVIKKIA